MQEIIREEQENEKLKRDLRAKEEEAKTLTLEARQACKDLAEAKVNMSTEKKKAMEELAALQEKNAHYKRILNELNAEMPCKGQERQKKVEIERTISTLKSELDKEKCARDELKASVDELEAKFGDVLKEKLELERQIVEMKRTKASKEERMDKIAKQNEKIENFMITAKCKLEKDKEKSEALDKDNRDLQDLCTGMNREVEEFLREMSEISKRLSEEHEHLQREGEKTKCEYDAFKEKVRDEMNKKCA
ncbi:intracellular protein transport protein USO1-like isoform X2 [Acropora millepora]|nr:intracellular protein transport protein USO1-like isoform X2 [Acropora millepora]